jgi:hypothetical protein
MKFQRRFFNLAKWMLACNLAAMGGKPYGPTGRLEFHLNGLHDFSVSLWIICQKQLGKTVKFTPGRGWSAS